MFQSIRGIKSCSGVKKASLLYRRWFKLNLTLWQKAAPIHPHSNAGNEIWYLKKVICTYLINFLYVLLKSFLLYVSLKRWMNME